MNFAFSTEYFYTITHTKLCIQLLFVIFILKIISARVNEELDPESP